MKIKDHNDNGESHKEEANTLPGVLVSHPDAALHDELRHKNLWHTVSCPPLSTAPLETGTPHQPGACLRVESWKEKRRETKRCLAPLFKVGTTPFSLGQRRKQTASAVSQPWQHARTCTRISSSFTKTMKCGEPGSYMKHSPAIYKIRKAAASKAQSRFYQQGFN